MKSFFTLLIAMAMWPSYALFASTHPVLNNSASGSGSLLQSIIDAEPGDTILFDSFLDGIPIFISSEIEINKELTILGDPNIDITIDASSNTRIFLLSTDTKLEIHNLRFVNGNAGMENGGAILSDGQLEIKACQFINNSANSGGAIYASKNYKIENGLFENNIAANYGGAIFHNGFANTMTPEILNSKFQSNHALNDGGAIFNYGYGGNSSPLIFNSIFSANEADDDGGAFYNDGSYGVSNPNFINCTFTNNVCVDKGAVIGAYGNMGQSQSVFLNCIIWENGNVDEGINASVFYGNTASFNLDHSLIQEADCPVSCDCNLGENMIFDQSPEFEINEDDDFNKFQLTENSPCLNMGLNEMLIYHNVSFDFDGNNRIVGNQVDLGANEFQTAVCDDCSQKTLNVKVFLEGACLPGTELMRTSLLSNGHLPIHHPYSAEPYFLQNDDDDVVYDDDFEELFVFESTDLVDWVMIELKESIEEEPFFRAAALLKNDGSIVSPTTYNSFSIDFEEAEDVGSFYILIRHRNHLDIISQETFIDEGPSISYDFSSSIEMARGVGQQKLSIDGMAMMISGDINGDLSIQTTDLDYWKATPAVLNVYNNADLNLDGSIQVTDYDLWFKNRSKLGNSEAGFND